MSDTRNHSQSWLLTALVASGHTFNHEGICSGASDAAAIQFIHSGIEGLLYLSRCLETLATYNPSNLLNEINKAREKYKSPQYQTNKDEKSSPHAESLIAAAALIEKFSINHQPTQYHSLFEKKYYSKLANNFLLIQHLLRHKEEKEVVEAAQFSGLYPLQLLIDQLNKWKNILKKRDITTNISLTLRNHDHKILIGYDSKEDN